MEFFTDQVFIDDKKHDKLALKIPGWYLIPTTDLSIFDPPLGFLPWIFSTYKMCLWSLLNFLLF